MITFETATFNDGIPITKGQAEDRTLEGSIKEAELATRLSHGGEPQQAQGDAGTPQRPRAANERPRAEANLALVAHAETWEWKETLSNEAFIASVFLPRI
jgi:hypothetical protein